MRYLLLALILASCSSEIEVAEHVGNYALIEWKGIKADGSTVHPYGDDAEGLLILTADGQMSLHLERANRPALGTDDYDELPSEQVLDAFKSYFSYHGSYTKDKEGLLEFEIEGCKNPDWIGRKLNRRYSLDGDFLTLRSDSVIGMDHILTWQRK